MNAIEFKRLQLSQNRMKMQLTQAAITVNPVGQIYQNSGFSGTPVALSVKMIAKSTATLIKRGYAKGIGDASFDLGKTMESFLTDDPTDADILNESLDHNISTLENLQAQRAELLGQLETLEKNASPEWQNYVDTGNQLGLELRGTLGEYLEINREQEALRELVREAEEASAEAGGESLFQESTRLGIAVW